MQPNLNSIFGKNQNEINWKVNFAKFSENAENGKNQWKKANSPVMVRLLRTEQDSVLLLIQTIETENSCYLEKITCFPNQQDISIEVNRNSTKTILFKYFEDNKPKQFVLIFANVTTAKSCQTTLQAIFKKTSNASLEPLQAHSLICSTCKEIIHIDCCDTLSRKEVPLLIGDMCYQFQCKLCGKEGNEKFQLQPQDWSNKVTTALICLSLQNPAFSGFLQDHIYSFLKENSKFMHPATPVKKETLKIALTDLAKRKTSVYYFRRAYCIKRDATNSVATKQEEKCKLCSNVSTSNPRNEIPWKICRCGEKFFNNHSAWLEHSKVCSLEDSMEIDEAHTYHQNIEYVVDKQVIDQNSHDDSITQASEDRGETQTITKIPPDHDVQEEITAKCLQLMKPQEPATSQTLETEYDENQIRNLISFYLKDPEFLVYAAKVEKIYQEFL